MPSSSGSNTFQELRLFEHFRQVYIRFYFHGHHQQAADFCQEYSSLLELPQIALLQHITKDREAWERWKKYIRGRKVSDCVWTISHALSDSAEVLFRFNRNEEGKQFCALAETVQGWARRCEEMEENRKIKEGG